MTESPQSIHPIDAPITLETLQSMDACSSGITEFLDAQKTVGPNAKLSQIAEHISLNYILWAIKRIDKKLYRMLACDYAEHTLHLFESKYPQDMRPRNAIVAGRKIATYAAYADAAYATYAYATYADATYADAATYDAYAATYAAYAAYAVDATYAATYATYATYATTYATYAVDADADAARQNEKHWQHSHTIKIIQAYESNTLDWNRMSLTESITIL